MSSTGNQGKTGCVAIAIIAAILYLIFGSGAPKNLAASVEVLNCKVIQAPNDAGENLYWAEVTWKNRGDTPISFVKGRYTVRDDTGGTLDDFEYTMFLGPPSVSPGETMTRKPPHLYALGLVDKYRLAFGADPASVAFVPTEARESAED